QHDQLDWEELLEQTFITLQRPSAVRLLLEHSLTARGRKLVVGFESHQLATVGRMVANGLGVSAVPSLCIRQMRELGACCVPLKGPQVERRIGLLRLADHALSSAAQGLADVLVKMSDWPDLQLLRSEAGLS